MTRLFRRIALVAWLGVGLVLVALPAPRLGRRPLPATIATALAATCRRLDRPPLARGARAPMITVSGGLGSGPARLYRGWAGADPLMPVVSAGPP